MNRISRYLFLECATSSLIALVVFTFVVMLPHVLRLVDMWVNKGVSVAVLGEMTLLAMPQFLAASIPMALLTGTLLTLGRLAQDSELVVLSACGISLYQMMRPVFVLTLLYTLLSLMLHAVWLPYASHHSSILRKALVSSTALTLKPKTFNHAVSGLTIYVDDQDIEKRLLKGILVHDQRQMGQTATLTARTGQLRTPAGGGETVLFLQEGTRHQHLGDNQYRELMFATYHMALGIDLGFQPKDIEADLEALSMGALSALAYDATSGKSYDARMEWHRRLAYPAANLILGLFAVALGVRQSHRSGRSYALVVAVLLLITHFFLLSLGESWAQKRAVDPMSGFWLPNLLMACLAGYVTIMTQRGKPFRRVLWLTQHWAMLPHRLLHSSSAEPR